MENENAYSCFLIAFLRVLSRSLNRYSLGITDRDRDWGKDRNRDRDRDRKSPLEVNVY